jgi:hypothetical protein
MNKREAIQQARKLWGKQAGVHYSNPKKDVVECFYIRRYWVGSQTYACNNGKGKVAIYGKGHTWEAAFEDATRRYKYWTLDFAGKLAA